MPNFIPLYEDATRPDAVHFVYTPGVPRMQSCVEQLSEALRHAVPQVSIFLIPIVDAYNMQDIQSVCEMVLEQYPDDEWTLNATGGTKLMSAPAMQLFMAREQKVLYVDTNAGQTLLIRPDWSKEPVPFLRTLPIETYFSLFGIKALCKPGNYSTETTLCRVLDKLDWQVHRGVKLYQNGLELSESDAMCVRHYKLFTFERKRLRKTSSRTNTEIWHALLKLYQIQRHYGGPFAKSYWVLSGGYELSPENMSRIRDFGVLTITGSQIDRILESPESFQLPAVKGTKSGVDNRPE